MDINAGTGRRTGRSDGKRAGRAAAAEIQIDPAAVAEYAVRVAGMGRTLDQIRSLLLEPGVSAVISETPDCFWASVNAQSTMTEAASQFTRMASRTVKLAHLFAEVDAAEFGTGIPQRVWESILAAEAEKNQAGGVLGFLDDVNTARDKNLVWRISFDDADLIEGALRAPGDLATVAGAVSTVGINRTIEKALSGRTSRAARKEAREALSKAFGESAIGGVNKEFAGHLVLEYTEGGSFGSIDELVARVEKRGGLPPGQRDAKRLELLAAAGRFSRSADVMRRALRYPGAKAAAASLRAVRAAGTVVPGGVASRVGSARATINQSLDAFVANQIAPRGSIGRAVAKAGALETAGKVLDVVLIPFEARNVFTKDTNLGRTSSALAVVSGTATVLAVATSWTGIGGIGFGTIALATGAGSAATGVGDVANQAYQQKKFQEAYDKAYAAAAAGAYEQAVTDEAQRELDAVLEQYEARKARTAGVPRQRPSSALFSWPNVAARLRQPQAASVRSNP